MVNYGYNIFLSATYESDKALDIRCDDGLFSAALPDHPKEWKFVEIKVGRRLKQWIGKEEFRFTTIS